MSRPSSQEVYRGNEDESEEVVEEEDVLRWSDSVTWEEFVEDCIDVKV